MHISINSKTRRLKSDKKIGVIILILFLVFVILSIWNQYTISKISSVANMPKKSETLATSDTTRPILTLQDSIVDYGMQLLGTPYEYAGCSTNGFDCSGFVYYVFQHFNITVPRSSSLYANFGKEIAITNVQKGDVLVFLSPTRNALGHVGIVTQPNGMETTFIHSSSGKEMKVILSNLKQDAYKKRFVKAVRVL